MLHKISVSNSTEEHPFISVQDYFSVIRTTHTERSQVSYLEVMDSKAGSKDTIMELLLDLYQQFIEGLSHKWLVVEGDGKLYDLLNSLQFEYGEELSWVIPYPGDWHMLMNYQTALIKPYYDVGLKALASAAGYPPASIQSCSQFTQTHNFIMEALEAVYHANPVLEFRPKHTGQPPSSNCTIPALTCAR